MSAVAPSTGRPMKGPPDPRRLVGSNGPLKRVVERAGRLAATEIPVLILGETGTGKELLARLVHRRSLRSRGPMLPVNCAALSESLLLADLFGHVRGAFTGADRDRAGIFEAAARGTVFLDEIGDLPPVAQGRLLRVLEEGEVRRVGESMQRAVDVRLVAATHRDLESMVERGEFRQDLYYRLGVGILALPPLRERGAGIETLAEHFLGRLANGRDLRLDRRSRRTLLDYPWPGNVRQLKNVLSVAAAVAEGPVILPEHLDLPVSRRPLESDYHQQVEAFRRRLVEQALAESGGNRARAARRLGLSRQAISYLARKLLT